MTLTEFLEARLGEDEAAAKAATPGPWQPGTLTAYADEAEARRAGLDVSQFAADSCHIARHDPARVLREVEAGRKILADLPAYSKQRRELRDHIYLPENAGYHSGHADGTDDAAYYVLRRLAAVWCDQADYDEAL